MRLLVDEKSLLEVEALEPVRVEVIDRLQQVIVTFLTMPSSTRWKADRSASASRRGRHAVLTVTDTVLHSEETRRKCLNDFIGPTRQVATDGRHRSGPLIVKSIGAAHGGRVKVQSTEDVEVLPIRNTTSGGHRSTICTSEGEIFASVKGLELLRRMHMNRKSSSLQQVQFVYPHLGLPVFAQTAATSPENGKRLNRQLGARSGSGDGAYKVGFPRSDLKVTVESVELKPALALGGGSF